jgi:hypothetical protein
MVDYCDHIKLTAAALKIPVEEVTDEMCVITRNTLSLLSDSGHFNIITKAGDTIKVAELLSLIWFAHQVAK